MAVTVKCTMFRYVTACSLVEAYRRYAETVQYSKDQKNVQSYYSRNLYRHYLRILLEVLSNSMTATKVTKNDYGSGRKVAVNALTFQSSTGDSSLRKAISRRDPM